MNSPELVFQSTPPAGLPTPLQYRLDHFRMRLPELGDRNFRLSHRNKGDRGIRLLGWDGGHGSSKNVGFSLGNRDINSFFYSTLNVSMMLDQPTGSSNCWRGIRKATWCFIMNKS